MSTRLGTPLDIVSTPLYYFDPSKTATQTLDGGGFVASRVDISGNNVVASCPASNHRPVPVASGIGGLSSVSYIGGQFELAPVSVTGKTLTAFAVVQPNNNINYARFMSFGSPPSNDWDNTASCDVELTIGTTQVHLNQNSTGTSSYSFTDNTPFIVEIVFDGTTASFFVSGTLIGTMPASGTFGVNTSTFGHSSQLGDEYHGLQGAQLAYSQALSTADRQWIEGCLAWQWDGGTAGALVSQLPANHPYKAAAPQVGASTGATGWNSSGKDPNVTVVSPREIRNDKSGGWYGVATTTSKSSGRWYFEAQYKLNGATSNGVIVGLNNTGAGLGNYPGSDASSVGLWDNGGQWLGGTPSGSSLGTLADGDTVSFDVDFDAKTIKAAKNGGAYTAVCSFAGVSGPFYIVGSFNTGPVDVVAAWAASDLKYAAPSGATPWDGAAAGGTTVSGTGTAAGGSTATAVGTVLARAAGTATGAATATGAGSVLARAAGSAAAGSTATGAGKATAAGTGTATGSSTATGAGSTSSLGSATGTAAGGSTATGVGSVLASGAGSAAGSSTGAGAGSALATGAGSATGSSTATGAGSVSTPGVSTGTATGGSTATGQGSVLATGTGTATGASTASGAGTVLVPTTGTATSSSTASAAGVASASGVGSAISSSNASGAGAATAKGTGTASGSSTASASGAVTGTIAGTGTADGGSSAVGVMVDLTPPATSTQHLGNLGWGGGGWHDDQVERGRTRLWKEREEEREELQAQLRRAFGLTLSEPAVSETLETPALAPEARDAIAKAARAVAEAVPAPWNPVPFIADNLPVWQAQANPAQAAAEAVMREAEAAHARYLAELDDDDEAIALLLAS